MQAPSVEIKPADGGRSPGVDGCAMCVLASGSGGNCTVVVCGAEGTRRAFLIDAGIGPRRTRALLREVGVATKSVDSIVLTHADTDHWRPGYLRMLERTWGRGESSRVRLFAHQRHAWAVREELSAGRAAAFVGPFRPLPGVEAAPVVLDHDEAGVAAFRFSFSGGGTLGFATDVGRVTRRLTEHMEGVDVLAIESNYCPRMQAASRRPEFLKRRIMGGRGHLSNPQTAAATEAIAPRSHAVFLHLSRECNRPELVAEMHEGAEYGFTITSQDRPTRWVPIAGGGARARRAARGGAAEREASLFA